MKRSQFNEDDVIAALLAHVGHGNKLLADLGARLLGSNTAHLIEDHGWTGVLVDADSGATATLDQVIGKRAKIINARVDINNVNDLVPRDIHLLSLDIDSTDFWVWLNLLARPAIVVVETNPEEGLFVACYPGKNKGAYGMSREAAEMLGRMKGYDCVGHNETNAFFVRADYECKYRLPPPARHAGIKLSEKHNVLERERACAL